MESSSPEFFYAHIPTQETIEDDQHIYNDINKFRTKKVKASSKIKQKESYLRGIEHLASKSVEKLRSIKKQKNLQNIHPVRKEDPYKYVTAKYFYLDEYCRKAINLKKDIHISRQEAINQWNSMSDQEKAIYEDMVPNTYENLIDKYIHKNHNRINSYNLFIRDKLSEAREKNTTQTISNCANIWNNLSPELKEQYAKYAFILRKEITQELENYIANIKYNNDYNILKYTWGPFKYFLLELFRNETEPIENEYEYTLHASEIWDNMSEEEQAKYMDIAADEKYDYINRKWEFLLHERRKNLKQPRSGFIIYSDELKRNLDNKEIRSTEDFEYIYEEWISLSEGVKNAFDDAAVLEMKDYQEEMTERIKNRRRNYIRLRNENKNETIRNKTGKKRTIEDENQEEFNHSKKGKFTIGK